MEEKETKKRGQGRPAYKPTDEKRKIVEEMAGFGVPHERIADILDIDSDTLKKYYKTELRLGKAKAHSVICQTLFKQATTGNTSALIFWAKTQLGWKETQAVEISGPDKGPVEVSEARNKLMNPPKKSGE